MRAVTCRVDAVAGELRAAQPEDAGGVRLQSRLLARLAVAQRSLHAGGEPVTPRARAALRRAGRLLRSVASTVERGARRGRIRTDLADRIVATVGDAVSELVPLLR